MNYLFQLSQIGLSEAEAKVYLTALELGESLHKQLAAKADVRRSTLYQILPSLRVKGLIVETVRGKRKYLVAGNLQDFIETKKTDLYRAEAILPRLQALANNASVKPKILIYAGIEGVKKVWADHLRQKQEILELVGIDNIHSSLQKHIKQYYILERSKKRIPLRMIISGSLVAGVFKVRSDTDELREVRKVDGKLFPVPLGMDVYGDNVSITLHRQESEPVGVIIRSVEVAAALRSCFEFIWLQAEEVK